MIANLLKDRCSCMPEAFRKAMDYLETVSADTPDGTYEIDGKRIFAMVQSGVTLGRTPEKMELHRKYIDIQYVFQGTEALAWAPATEDLEVIAPYDEEKDYLFVKTPRIFSMLELHAGAYAVFMPADAHYGKLASAAEGAMPIRKVVVKIDVSLL